MQKELISRVTLRCPEQFGCSACKITETKVLPLFFRIVVSSRYLAPRELAPRLNIFTIREYKSLLCSHLNKERFI